MDKVWRCECCGEMMDALNPAWRWTGEVWQHHHPESMMHYDARPFGIDLNAPTGGESRRWTDAEKAELNKALGLVAELERLRKRVAELEAAQSADLEIAIGMLADWCVCVSDNGTGWDDWDECYKDVAYREGPLRDRIDLAMANIRALRTHR